MGEGIGMVKIVSAYQKHIWRSGFEFIDDKLWFKLANEIHLHDNMDGSIYLEPLFFT